MRISDWSSDVCSSDLGDPRLEPLACDLESDEPPGFLARRFGGIVVTNYLHRPLLAPLTAALAPGGVLIYETFARGNERFGKPSNPAFLLEEGRSEEHTSELQSLMRISYAVFCLNTKTN